MPHSKSQWNTGQQSKIREWKETKRAKERPYRAGSTYPTSRNIALATPAPESLTSCMRSCKLLVGMLRAGRTKSILKKLVDDSLQPATMRSSTWRLYAGCKLPHRPRSAFSCHCERGMLAILECCEDTELERLWPGRNVLPLCLSHASEIRRLDTSESSNLSPNPLATAETSLWLSASRASCSLDRLKGRFIVTSPSTTTSSEDGRSEVLITTKLLFAETFSMESESKLCRSTSEKVSCISLRDSRAIFWMCSGKAAREWNKRKCSMTKSAAAKRMDRWIWLTSLSMPIVPSSHILTSIPSRPSALRWKTTEICTHAHMHTHARTQTHTHTHTHTHTYTHTQANEHQVPRVINYRHLESSQ